MTALRNAPLSDASKTALLVVDVQYAVAALGVGDHAAYDEASLPADKRWYFDRIGQVMLPNIRALQDGLRSLGSEVLFTTVENLTNDGRDRSLDYKVSGINVARGSREAQVLDVIAPKGDEIRLPKTTSSVFNSTNIDYLLRNFGVERLIIVGLLTDQCVISAVRDACDRGYLVVVPEDACATYTEDRHNWALELTKGYCRVTDTQTLLDEMATLAPTGRPHSAA